MIRSTFIGLLFIGLVSALAGFGLFGTPETAQAAPLFRVIDVRAEYGQLVIEVQHFRANGSHWFYENYTWSGQENDKRPREVNRAGKLLLDDGQVAPVRRVQGKDRQYVPEGRRWAYQNRPHLDRNSLLSVIRGEHNRRMISGWTKGRQRLTTHPMDNAAENRAGALALRARFQFLRGTAYAPNDTGSLMAYAGPLPPIDPYISTAWGTVSIAPLSLDGQVSRGSGGNEDFGVIRAGAGDAHNDTAGEIDNNYKSSTTSNKYITMTRGIYLFDTSDIDDTDILDSAVFEFVSTGKTDTFTDSLSMVTSTPASDTALANADYGQLGTTKQATDLTVAGITADSSTFNTFTLNATGEGNITFTGITKFGTRLTRDNDNNAPTWQSDKNERVLVASAEESIAGDKRPRLIITHSPAPTAAITGTIGDGATEQEVRDGGGTIIITISDGTWVADGATFDAQRQAIIDGIDSAQSETYGWNAEVRDKLGVDSVVRTSSTIATVTISASEVADYRISSSETLTVTVPAAAYSGASDMTATPTITITTGAESVAVSGTLGGSGGTPAEIRAGGETVILTLTDTVWVADGSTFNAERQAIIDGLDSNLADQNGWDNRRADFAVGDVVRTSGTIVTITLSASAAYAIPATETITAVVPASAVVYGAALTGAPTFAIVPTFAAAGNRISPSIDLSSITEVAYCAIGWQATTPADTSVTVTTSIDGGATYSAATNGECPTGVTAGGDLSTITDFRIKVALATDDDTATPLVEGLGLLVQDTSGPALLYQLNTVPGITITDRSANSNTGTMSFPTSQTGVNATTGVLESTRSKVPLSQLLSVGDIVSPVTGAAASGNIFNQTETGFGSLPFQSMMQTMATGGELPLKFVWVVAIGLFSIALGVVALHLTGSLMISGVGMGAGLSVGAAVGAGLIPGWTIILFVILALALIVMRSRGALPL